MTLQGWLRVERRSVLDAKNSNIETLAGNKDLKDTDYPIQVLDCDGADRDVGLPQLASSNHLFAITNATAATYTLTVKYLVTTLIVLAPGETVEVMSNTAGWQIIGGGSTGGGPVLHALDSTVNHSIGGLTNTYLVKSDGSKLVPATNTDAQVALTVTNSQTAIVSASEPSPTKIGLIWVDIS